MYYLEGQGGGGLHVSLNLERVFTTVAVGVKLGGGRSGKALTGVSADGVTRTSCLHIRQLLHSSHDNNSCLVEHVAYVS